MVIKSIEIQLRFTQLNSDIKINFEYKLKLEVLKLTKIFMHITRLLLGVIFLAAGLNGYFLIFGIEPFIATSPEAMALI